MDFEEEFELEHLLFKERKCRSCCKVKDLLVDFYKIRRDRTTISAYSYECKECTIRRIVNRRKKCIDTLIELYPDW
jgi:hypothetical protein